MDPPIRGIGFVYRRTRIVGLGRYGG